MENFEFDVLPNKCMFNQMFTLQVGGIEKDKLVRISSSMRLPWDKNNLYTAYGVFKVNEEGNIDITKDAPIEGTYTGVDPMGLIYSMKKEADNSGVIVTKEIHSSDEIQLLISVEVDNFKMEKTVTRLLKPVDVISEKTDVDGFIGEMLYHGDDTRRKTIVLLGGFEGGINSLIPIAGALSAEGFNVLALAYFGVGYLPSKLSKIPLEYFDKAIDWLKKKSYVDDKKIGLIGYSKGGELALLLSALKDDFKTTVAVMPSNYRMEYVGGLFTNKAPWVYKGEDLEYINIDKKAYLLEMLKSIKNKENIGQISIYKNGVETAANKESAKIEVENIKGDVLLFSAKDDNIWQSYEFCTEAEKTLKARSGYKHVEHISYENTGHCLYAPLLPVEMEYPISFGGKLELGGDLQSNIRSQMHGWNYLISYLRMHL